MWSHLGQGMYTRNINGPQSKFFHSKFERSLTLRGNLCFRMQVGRLCVANNNVGHAAISRYDIQYGFIIMARWNASFAGSLTPPSEISQYTLPHARVHDLQIPVAAQTPSAKTLIRLSYCFPPSTTESFITDTCRWLQLVLGESGLSQREHTRLQLLPPSVHSSS